MADWGHGFDPEVERDWNEAEPGYDPGPRRDWGEDDDPDERDYGN